MELILIARQMGLNQNLVRIRVGPRIPSRLRFEARRMSVSRETLLSPTRRKLTWRLRSPTSNRIHYAGGEVTPARNREKVPWLPINFHEKVVMLILRADQRRKSNPAMGSWNGSRPELGTTTGVSFAR